MSSSLIRLVLVRHAESTGNAKGSLTGDASDELTATGVGQAIRLKGELQRYGVFEKVYSSNAQRALQTARLAGFPNPMVLPEFAETDGGSWANRSRVQFETAFPNFFTKFDPAAAYPDGESHVVMSERTLKAFRERVCSEPANTIAFMHLGPINALLHSLLDIPLERFPVFQLAHCRALDLTLEIGRGQGNLVRIVL